MAKVRAVFQPFVGSTFHGSELTKILSPKSAKSITISSAFVHSNGVRTLSPALSVNSKVCQCFVGIRNGVTTVQGVKELLALGVSVFVVDTGSQRRLFHPKFYAVERAGIADVVIGSANLTYGGLGLNIEASVHLSLDLTDSSDATLLSDLRSSLQKLLKDHPKNCYPLNTDAEADKLRAEGLLEDETSPVFNIPVGIASAAKTPGATVPTINLPALPKPATSKPARSTKPASSVKGKPAATKPGTPSAPVSPPVIFGPLVWSKPDLPPSDLQFPGPTGSATGVLRLTQAKFQVGGTVINQTTYFRQVVFGGLSWSTAGGKETAHASFALVIAGVVVGSFTLALSHKSSWESGQGNYTTGLHWGAALPYINDKSLVGRELRLYAPATPGSPFVIAID